MNFISKLVNRVVLKKRLVMVVTADGDMTVSVVEITDSGKAFVVIEAYGEVGFLDSPSQKEGEFRKNISSENLVRWFNI